MRRAVLGVLAAGLLAGCAAQPVAVPGQAAPVVAPTGAATPPVSGTPTAVPTGAAQLPPLPRRYETLAMSGFGVSVSLPVPAGWASADNSSAQRRNTDLVPPEAPDLLLLRIDLTPRGAGSAEDGARGVEAALTLRDYHRLSFTPVTGVGDDAVDWYFDYDQGGTGMWVCDRQIVAGSARIAVYLRVPERARETYLPLLRTVLDGLRITTS